MTGRLACIWTRNRDTGAQLNSHGGSSYTRRGATSERVTVLLRIEKRKKKKKKKIRRLSDRQKTLALRQLQDALVVEFSRLSFLYLYHCLIAAKCDRMSYKSSSHSVLKKQQQHTVSLSSIFIPPVCVCVCVCVCMCVCV